MKIAKVVGNVVSTVKHYSHQNYKLMIVRQCDEQGECTGDEKIAIDIVSSGEGDYVLMLDDGGASRMLVDTEKPPVDAVIVGVLDYLPCEE